MTKQSNDIDTDEWYTPDGPVLVAVRDVLGSIDLDPASCATAQTTVKAKMYYTQATDGLAQAWRGTVYLNPPYSKPLPWVKKLIASFGAGQVTSAILLVNTANSPKWARLLWNSNYTVCMLKDRIHFVNPDKPDLKRTMQDQMVWYLGKRTARFAKAFSSLGSIMVPYPIAGIECLICERQFMPKRADALYCSAACNQKAKRERAKQ